jgi:hypothetical protein
VLVFNPIKVVQATSLKWEEDNSKKFKPSAFKPHRRLACILPILSYAELHINVIKIAPKFILVTDKKQYFSRNLLKRTLSMAGIFSFGVYVYGFFTI